MKQEMRLGVLHDTLDAGPISFQDLRAMAQMAEAVGLDSFWLIDHLLLRLPAYGEVGCWESFTQLGAIAAVTKQITLGPLVACTSFRNPALLAKMVDSLDEISGGRIILGLGCGWHEAEYTAFGYPFDRRVSRFEEAIQIIVPLLRSSGVDFQGSYYNAWDAVLLPRGPSPAGPPIWIGANNPRMMRLAAQYGDAWNTVWHLTPKTVEAESARIRAICAEVGRDPKTLAITAGTAVCVLKSGERANPHMYAIQGSSQEIAVALQGFAEIGVTHLIIVVKGRDSINAIEDFGDVVTRLRKRT